MASRLSLIGALCATSVLVMSGLAGCGGNKPDSSSPSYQLAALDRGGSASVTADLVEPYQEALDALAEKCTEPEQRQLADYAQVSVVELAKSGVRSSRIEMLRSAEKAIPASLGKTRCADIFASLVTLMEHY